MVPGWHVGDYKKHGLTTNNARLENIENSKLYKQVLHRGGRCVVPVEGFYEWNTTNPKLKSSERPVFYIYNPQKPDVKIEAKSTWNCEDVNLMFVAGLFDVWHDEAGESLYSFTIVTFESNEHFNWLHHRTPAILESENQVRDWLDYKRISTDQALKLIKHPKHIIWHEVSNFVNSSRNKSDGCNKPFDKKKESESPNSLMSWIKKNKTGKPA